MSCPRVGEFFACRLGNTEGRRKRGLEESEGRKCGGGFWSLRVEARVTERVDVVETGAKS